MQKMISRLINRCRTGALMVAVAAFAPLGAAAQSPFSPAITVNDEVITQFELEQRARLFALLQISTDPDTDARSSLIEDRLKQVLIREAEINVAPEELQLTIEDMAINAQLSAQDFIAALEQNGVAYQTLRDFLETTMAWNEYARLRFLARARPTEAEIDQALGQTGRGTIEVSLAEVIIPVTAQNAQQVDAVAAQISQITDYEQFSEAARRYSQAPTALDGGVSGWLSVANLPPLLRGPLLSLAPGKVTSPILLGNAVGLFQLRGIREVSGGNTSFSEIDYAVVTMAPSGLRDTPQQVMASFQRCDDIYGLSIDNSAVTVQRFTQAPSAVPRDIGVALARLDADEAALLPGTVQGGQLQRDGDTEIVPMVRGVMVCSRTAAVNDDATREDVSRALSVERLNSLSSQFLEQRLAEAIIIEN